MAWQLAWLNRRIYQLTWRTPFWQIADSLQANCQELKYGAFYRGVHALLDLAARVRQPDFHALDNNLSA